MPEGQSYNWGNTLGTIATMATGNPYAGLAANSIYNWTRQDKGDKETTNFNTGKLASSLVQSYAARKSAKSRSQSMQNAGKLDLGYLRAEAEKNGFNPLTVLRATGGQGSTKSYDHGKMASSAFWSTFADNMPNLYDYNDKKINNNNKIRTTINSNEILGSSNLNNNGKLNAFQNLGVTDYEYLQQPFENETVKTPFGTVDHKNKSMWGIFESRHGKRIAFPWTEWEGDQMLTMGFANLFLEATHFRDKGISAFNKWWKNAPKDNLSKKQIREIVNLRKINKSYLHTPKLSTEWINSAEKALQ